MDGSSEDKIERPGTHVPAADGHAGGVNGSDSTISAADHDNGRDKGHTASGTQARAAGDDKDAPSTDADTDNVETQQVETQQGGAEDQTQRPRALQPGQRHVLAAKDNPDLTAIGYSSRKKWWILSVIFLVQTSMNFNTSLYSNGIGGIAEEFGVSEQAARAGAAVFLITYAFGCELWAPWSEEIGRKLILQLSLGLVNIWAIMVAVAPNFGTIMAGRALGGFSTAGGSVTLGMIADMYKSDDQQNAVAYIVFSSVGGSILGPIVGGFVEQYLHWRWTIWIQFIFGAAVQALHFFTVPETRNTSMLTKIARKRRQTGVDPNVYGPDELNTLGQRFSLRQLWDTIFRPFRMFFTEPIVFWLSMLSGFSDALIFMCIQSFALVYKQWGFSPSQIGLSFIPIGIGYVIGWLAFIGSFRYFDKKRETNGRTEYLQYESRMTLLLFLAPCLPAGLVIFAWTSGGPPLHWIGTMVGSAIIGIANYAIYMATIDYMVCAYGPYSASATGGNGWARDFLAGVLTPAAVPFYSNIGAKQGRNLEYASTVLFCISIGLVVAVYIIYFKGQKLRTGSDFAQNLAREAVSDEHVRRGLADEEHPMEVPGDSPMRITPFSRHSSYYASREASVIANSRANSRVNSRNNSMDLEMQPIQNLMPIASIPTQQTER